MTLKELLCFLPSLKHQIVTKDVEITSIEMDSRKVKQNSLFVCIKGFTVDGHDFVDEAMNNGAAAIVAEKQVSSTIPLIIVPNTTRFIAMVAAKFYGYPTNQIPMIGVTGTNGKTTVTYLLEKIFNTYQIKTGIIGTIQLKIGENVYPINNTTPDALLLQQTIKKMKDEGCKQVIMEVSSHALDLGRVYGCDFNIAVFTNLSQDHLDYHRSMEDYLHAKSLLFAQLGNSYSDSSFKYGVINMDDEASDFFCKSTAQPLLTYGIENKADIMAENILLDANGTSFTLTTPNGDVEIKSPLIGKFNVYNMLAASAAAIASQIPLSVIQKSFRTIQGVNGRFERIKTENAFSVIVDYAHTPDSLENVLRTINTLVKGRVIVVVGCGGDRDRTKRPIMASIAVKYADLAIFTSDNPRTEDPHSILNDMTEKLDGSNYDIIVDRKEAIFSAVHEAEENDIILIAGKGHETYQQIGLKKIHFDDRLVAKEAIESKEF